MKVFSYADAQSRSLLIDGQFPVASLDDIIASKRAANRAKDRESLPRLEAFRDYLRSRNLTALPTNPPQPRRLHGSNVRLGRWLRR